MTASAYDDLDGLGTRPPPCDVARPCRLRLEAAGRLTRWQTYSG